MEVNGKPHAPITFPPGEWHPIPLALHAGWAPEPIWTFWRRKEYVSRTGIRTSDRLTRSLITIRTELSRVLTSEFPDIFRSLSLFSSLYEEGITDFI
jgi:hypothetical protein